MVLLDEIEIFIVGGIAGRFGEALHGCCLIILRLFRNWTNNKVGSFLLLVLLVGFFLSL